MFDAPKNIYEDMHAFLKGEFLAVSGEDNAEKPFIRFERGVIHITPQNVDFSQFPMAYLEWGSITEVKPYQAPEGYTYDFVVPLCILTFQQEGRPGHAVFRERDDLAYGIGDLVSCIVQKTWQAKHFNRFTNPGTFNTVNGRDWTIIDWSLSVEDMIRNQPGEIERVPSNLPPTSNPFVRATQIDFKFQVFERDALGRNI